ncbi:hypothetical protein L7F22_002902 [Adiantum nelumboides]|nr:hypothetical protein [Adiantum nelumboides]
MRTLMSSICTTTMLQMGILPDSKATTESVFNAALALAIANQLTIILRNFGEDARRGKIYLQGDELEQFGILESDNFSSQVTDKWRVFMRIQIKRALMFFDISEQVVRELDKDSRWPVKFGLLILLCSIEANDYNNFTKRAYIGK